MEKATKPPKAAAYRNAICQVIGSFSALTSFGTAGSVFGVQAGASRIISHVITAITTSATAMMMCVGK